jgi:hypothetical protein
MSKISPKGICSSMLLELCSSVVLISAGALKNPQKSSPGNPALKSISKSEERLL